MGVVHVAAHVAVHAAADAAALVVVALAVVHAAALVVVVHVVTLIAAIPVVIVAAVAMQMHVDIHSLHIVLKVSMLREILPDGKSLLINLIWKPDMEHIH